MGRIVEEMKYMQTNTYCLHVSRDELEALYLKASCVSVTIEQLLKDIIADLVDGTFTHGSDERMYVDFWYARWGAETNSLDFSDAGKLQGVREVYIPLQLTNADTLRLQAKADCVGCNESQLLEAFVMDLISGRFTHGSDERMYTDQWFRRCYMFPDKTFIRYLIMYDKVDELLKDCERLKEYREDYVRMQKSPAEYEPDEVVATQKEIETLNAYIKEIYEFYVKSLDGESPEGSLEAVINKLQVWNERRLKLLKGEYEI
jgi:hypothetical protein|uniref:hypothetical protein n=1 Tax=Enterocloster clostridioformis TaxID=1531 RepID=UPI0026743EA9|nr:hypothetical protein [Enterocloster clostridioformis]